MKTTTSVWHSVADGDLPEKSGVYLTAYLNSTHFTELYYSEKYKAFNVCDFYTVEEVEMRKFAINYWTEVPQFDEE